MTGMRRPPREEGFALLAGLRRIERRMRRVRREWRSFRDDPTANTLHEVRRQARRLSHELANLANGLTGDTGPAPSDSEYGSPSAPAPDRPAARDVVRASRELETWILRASAGWKSVVDDPGEEHFGGLVNILERAADQARVLVDALGGATARSGPVLRGTNRPTGTAAERIESAAAELEAVLWRVQSDWHHVRRAPSIERIRILEAELREAAELADGLRRDVDEAGATAFRRALRTGVQSADSVRFRPFRDPFTGAYNREGFDTLAGAELKRCRRYGRRFGLLVLEITPVDLDALRALVTAARSELREYDLLARYGGDMLVVGLPEGGSGPARRVASRILNGMRRSGAGGGFRSLAYATMPEDASTLSGLLEAARSRLGGEPPADDSELDPQP